MRIYIDEDLASALLVRLLANAGHDVQTTVQAGLLGRSDPIQLTSAIHDRQILLTANYEDFEELHLLIQEAQGSHSGIMVVRQDNDPTRDMTAKGIVAAIRNLETAGIAIKNEYVILNHWR